jgi:multidrug efflux pump subunit AcrA (membrane-fusion protein)
MVKNNLILSLALGFLLLAAQGCTKKEEAVKNEEIIPVKVAKVELKDIQNSLDYTGNIKAQDEAVVYPKVNGKILEKTVEEGGLVNKGDVIAYIDRDEVGFKFEKAPVESSLTGIVGRVYVDKGMSVTVQTPIALVVDSDKVKINLDIPESYLARISLGQEARVSVDTYPDEKFAGKITRISPVVNMENRAAPIEITIENQDHRLKSGMFVKVSLVTEKHQNTPVILKEALIGREPDSYVYTVENSKAMMRKVSLGIHDGPFYEVTQGLKEGDMVVIMGQQRLYDNAKVSAEMNGSIGGEAK